MEDYTSSIQPKLEAKEEKRAPVQPVASGIIKKKSIFSKFTGLIFSNDGKDVGDFLTRDVLVPAIKKTIQEMVTSGIDVLLYGESRGQRRRNPSDSVSYRYDRCYDDDRDRRRRDYYDRDYDKQPRRYQVYEYNDVGYYTRKEAEDVIRGMLDIVDQYDYVKVADMYELSKIKDYDFNANHYGWSKASDLQRVEAIRYSDGKWGLDLPKAIPID